MVAVMVVGQRKLLYFPIQSHMTPDQAGVPEMTPVHFTTDDGLRLEAWYRPPEPGHATVLYFHGNAGHIGHRAYKVRPFLDAGLGVLLVAYRGYFTNPGTPTEEGLALDARAALSFLESEKQALAANDVVVYGESLGTGVAVRLASARRLRAVVLEAPFTSMVDAGRHHYPWLPVGRLLKDRYDSLSRIAGIAAPLLIIHGARDRIVPVEMGKRLYEAATEPKRLELFPDAIHVDLHERGAAPVVLTFIDRN